MMRELLSWSGWIPLSLTLLHALWQTTLLAFLLAGILRLLPAARSSARYGISLLFLAGALIMAAATFGILSHQNGESGTAQAAHVEMHHASTDTAVTTPPTRAPEPSHAPAVTPGAAQHPAQLHPATAIGIFWVLGSCLMMIRAGSALMATKRLLRDARSITDASISQPFLQLCRDIGFRAPVRLMQTNRLSTAGALGIINPVILVPGSMLSGLTKDELRLVLAHELAHLHRRDFLINILQMLVEALLFFCPAIWWINRVIRREREACCDQLAAQCGGSTAAYATVLARCAAPHRTAHAARHTRETIGDLAMRFSGEDAPLLDRVRRLLEPGHHPHSLLPLRAVFGTFATGLVVLMLLISGSSMAARVISDVLSPAERLMLLRSTAEQSGLPAAALDDAAPSHVLRGTWTLPADHPGFAPWHPHRSLVVSALVQTAAMTSHVRGAASADGHFELSVRSGELTILFTGEGIAPTAVGPFRVPAPGGELPGVDVTLTTGFPARMSFRSESGEPLAGAAVTVAPTMGSLAAPSSFTSDESGTVHIPHAWSGSYRLTLRADGFEAIDAADITLDPKEPTVITLTPVEPAVIRVTDAEGNAVPGARARLAGVLGSGHIRSFGEQGEILATSDATGTLRLASLQRTARHALVIESDHHAPALLTDVRAGDQDLHMILADERTITASLSRDVVEQIPSGRQGRNLVLRQSLPLSSDHTHRTFRNISVDVHENGSGTFRATGLFAASTTLELGDRTLWSGTPEEGAHVIDINAFRPASAPHTFIIDVHVPDGHPPAFGTVTITRFAGSSTAAPAALLRATLTNGRVTVDARTGDRLSVTPDGLLNAWFPGPVSITADAGKAESRTTIDAMPAGAIHVRIIDVPGIHERWITGVRSAVSASPLPPGAALPQSIQADAQHTAFIAPVPLGGTYAVIASSGYRYLAGDPIEVNEMQPLPRIELDAQPASDVVIRLVDAHDRPLAGHAVGLRWRYGDHSFSRSPAPETDANGTVRFRLIPMESGGSYSADLHATEEFAAAEVPLTIGQSQEIVLQRGPASASVK